MKITNNAGKHAFIGIAFNERNDAFDFNVALLEHKKEQEREKNGVEAIVTSTRDLSLKEGEKIKINIGNMVFQFIRIAYVPYSIRVAPERRRYPRGEDCSLRLQGDSYDPLEKEVLRL